MPNIPPTKEEILEIVRQNPSALQFKNSMKFVQTSTNMTLDRMVSALDLVLAVIYLEGFTTGMEIMVNGTGVTGSSLE